MLFLFSFRSIFGPSGYVGMTFRLVVILNLELRIGHRFLGDFSPAMEMTGRLMPSRNLNAQITYLRATKPADAKHG